MRNSEFGPSLVSHDPSRHTSRPIGPDSTAVWRSRQATGLNGIRSSGGDPSDGTFQERCSGLMPVPINVRAHPRMPGGTLSFHELERAGRARRAAHSRSPLSCALVRNRRPETGRCGSKPTTTHETAFDYVSLTPIARFGNSSLFGRRAATRRSGHGRAPARTKGGAIARAS